MASYRWSLLVLMSLLLGSCVNFNRNDWPETIPPRQYFQCAYEADPVNQRYQDEQEYLNWIVDFYKGSLLYATGWEYVEEVVLDRIAPEQMVSRREQLQELGKAIASEWAKHNDVRRIDNRLLSLWASILQLSANEDELGRAIDLISQDIAAILSGELAPSAADDLRYQEKLQLELFESF